MGDKELVAGREQVFEVNDERIEQWTLLRALSRIGAGFLSVEQTGYEDEEWKAFRCYGGVNDREYESVATAGSLIGLLTILGAKDGKRNG